MSETGGLPIVIAAAVVGLVAVILIMRRMRHQEEEATAESPFAASTEGEKRCPKCGMGNLWTDDHCISCGTRLADSHQPSV